MNEDEEIVEVCVECGVVPEFADKLDGWKEIELGHLCPRCSKAEDEVEARAAEEGAMNAHGNDFIAETILDALKSKPLPESSVFDKERPLDDRTVVVSIPADVVVLDESGS